MTNPDLIPVPFAQDGDKNTIPLERIISDPAYRATWLEGFPPDTRIPEEVGGEAPDGLDFNGLFNALSQAVVFLQRGNAYQFDVSMAPYPIGALVRSDDGLTTYQSTVAGNSNNPNSNMTGWRLYNSSDFVVDNLTTDDAMRPVSAKQAKLLQDNKLDANKRGATNGVASLDANKKVPVAELPSATSSAAGVMKLINDLTTGGTDAALTADAGKLFFEMFRGGSRHFCIPDPNEPDKPWIIQFGISIDITKAVISYPVAFPNSPIVGLATADTANSIAPSASSIANIFFPTVNKKTSFELNSTKWDGTLLSRTIHWCVIGK